MPFLVIGVIGMTWAIPWLTLVRSGDLDRDRMVPEPEGTASSAASHGPRALLLMFLALVIVVICINLSWQFFRAWLPMFLEEANGYSKEQVQSLTSAYYVAADVGCISVGFLATWLAGRGWDVHSAHVFLFGICAALTGLSVAYVYLPPGPLLVGAMLVVAAASLGLFPNYYSFAQEPSRRHQGKISGCLGTIAWLASSRMQTLVGANIDATKSYANGIMMAGLMPVLGLAALLLLWPRHRRWAATDVQKTRGQPEGEFAGPSGMRPEALADSPSGLTGIMEQLHGKDVRMSDAFLISAVRTPIGKYLGGLAERPAPNWPRSRLKEALSRANEPADRDR